MIMLKFYFTLNDSINVVVLSKLKYSIKVVVLILINICY